MPILWQWYMQLTQVETDSSGTVKVIWPCSDPQSTGTPSRGSHPGRVPGLLPERDAANEVEIESNNPIPIGSGPDVYFCGGSMRRFARVQQIEDQLKSMLGIATEDSKELPVEMAARNA